MLLPSSLHVVHVMESFGGGCLTALSALCHCVRDDIQHTVIYSPRVICPDNFREYFPSETKFHLLPMQRAIHPRADIKAFFALCDAFTRLRPHVVHAHSSKAGVLARLAARCKGIPSVYTPHGYAFLNLGAGPVQRAVYHAAEWLAARAGNAIAACGAEEYALSRQLAGKHGTVICIPNALFLERLDAMLTQLPPPAHCVPER